MATDEFVFEDDDSEEIENSSENTETGPDPDRGPLASRATYAWALDCDWVWQNLGGKMTRKQAGTPARWELWKLAKADIEKFVNGMMPRAMMLLEKALDKQGDTNVVIVEERRQISELKQILKDALVEAGRV